MGEDLKQVNKAFELFISKLKKKPDKNHEAELYFAFLCGFLEGSGMSQVVV